MNTWNNTNVYISFALDKITLYYKTVCKKTLKKKNYKNVDINVQLMLFPNL